MSSTKPAIRVQDLSKTYKIYGNPYHRILESMPWNKGQTRHRAVHALKDINFEVGHGTCVGLIGGNGAGKSTMLKILTGTSFPSHGEYEIQGHVASLLELGAGFHTGFSGRENIYMNAALMGFTRKETKKKFEEILDFSELGDFIDAPLRTYSSGMVCRLGFAVAVASDPDILIIDEILAVGDMHFQRKCVDKIFDYKRRGKTMLFCSHSLYDVRQICDQAIWLKGGQIEMHADSVTVTNEYATYENQLSEAQEVTPWDDLPEGEAPIVVDRSDDYARIVSADLVDPKTGEKCNAFDSHDPVAVRVHIKNGKLYEPLQLAIGFTRRDGTLCFAPHTGIDGDVLEFQEGVVTMVIPEMRLLSGEFIVPVYLLDKNGVHRFHELPCTENLIIKNRNKELGLFYSDRKWEVEVITGPPAQ